MLVLGCTRRAGDFPAAPGPVHRACLHSALCPVVIVGCLTPIAVLYLALEIGVLGAVPWHHIVTSTSVASLVVQGTWGRNVVTALIVLSAAALIVDYTLTVAVSISAGVAALASAFPVLGPVTVPVSLGVLAVITLLNLRGLGDTARAFLLPTAVFIAGLLAIIAVGLIHPLGLHAAQPGRPPLPARPLAAVTVLLLLKAFSAGCSALTGVEAIANGVPLFRQPRTARAKRTEVLLGAILGLMLLGLAVLARRWHIAPRSGQTVLSQIIAAAVGRHWAYYLVTLAVTGSRCLRRGTAGTVLPARARSRGTVTSSPEALRTVKESASAASRTPRTSAISSLPSPAGRRQRITTRRPASPATSRTSRRYRITSPVRLRIR